jgi:hypothetical protein
VLLDALRSKYMMPSSADQAAFHEGYSDVIALLSVFSQREIVEELLCRKDPAAREKRTLKADDVTADALKDSALLGLAEEMGQGMSKDLQDARGGALRRSVRIDPDPHILDSPEFEEPHRRGEVFAAAVLNAFVGVWQDRMWAWARAMDWAPSPMDVTACAASRRKARPWPTISLRCSSVRSTICRLSTWSSGTCCRRC